MTENLATPENWELIAHEEDRQRAILAKQKFKAHRVMTPEEYAAMPLIGWHMVCRDFDGFGGVGIRFVTPPKDR